MQTALERWRYFLRHGATLDAERLPVQLEVPAIREAVEVLMELSQNERERIRAQDRLQGMTDAANILHEARNAHQRGLEEGLAKGLEKGLEKGREVGRWIGRIQLYQEELGQPVTPENDLLQRSLDELKYRADELEQQLSKGVITPDNARVSRTSCQALRSGLPRTRPRIPNPKAFRPSDSGTEAIF